MGLFKATYRVVRTIWPYDDGWGVVKEQFSKPITVLSSGLTKKQAEDDLESLEL
tara:strand:- start:3944 stop:4105 length:162 start_codon:yes stop_codon:yes gene_type:complete